MPANRSKSEKHDAAKQLRRDPYEVLGVQRNSTDQEIKSAYRKMALKVDYLNGGTGLHFAALNGHSRCIRLILADYIPSNPNSWNILRKRSKKEESNSEFDQGALFVVINRTADGGITALHMAALNGHVGSVHLLLDLGAPVSKVTIDDGTTIYLIELVNLVERTVKSENNRSPKRPMYLVGKSLRGSLALAVAARNPDIDLIIIASNPGYWMTAECARNALLQKVVDNKEDAGITC